VVFSKKQKALAEFQKKLILFALAKADMEFNSSYLAKAEFIFQLLH
jgi:hypothetical protein